MTDQYESELVDQGFLDHICFLEEAALKSKKRERENESDCMEITNDEDVFSSEGDHRPEEKNPEKKTQNILKNFLGLKEGEKRSAMFYHAVQECLPRFEDSENVDQELPSSIPQDIRPDFENVISAGARLKLIASVFLGRLDENSNIFVPSFKAKVVGQDGTLRVVEGFLKSSKGQMFVFASGGTGRVWEKTVSRVYEIFFGQEIKIIRESWLARHVGGIDLKRKNCLHSEYFFDLFLRRFGLKSFLPHVSGRDKILSLDFFCFSWWDVCDECFKDLSSHNQWVSEFNVQEIHYHVAARRRYKHSLRENSVLSNFCVSDAEEKAAWEEVWSKVKEYTLLNFPNDDEKEKFWTKTVEGLEICKWIGQAFVENKHDVYGTRLPLKDGDLLKHYEDFTGQDQKSLSDLIEYLAEKNWDLSCWYSHHVPHEIQKSWKKNWRHVVVPHFSWVLVADFDDDSGDNVCEMCGNEDISKLYWMYHPKLKLSQKFFDLSEEDQNRTEKDYGFSFRTKYEDLYPHLQRARRQSLVVGSKCQEFLQTTREELDAWRKKNSPKDLKKKIDLVNERQEQYNHLDKAEATSLLFWLRKNVAPGDTFTTRFITSRIGDCVAEDINPQLLILVQDRSIIKQKRGEYRLNK